MAIEEQLARYQQLREIHKDLHRALMNQLPENALQECGMKLGVYKNNTLVLGSENEMAALMDYCIYDYRWDGRNVIERYINQTPLKTGSNRMILLNAMQDARYSLFVADEVVKGAGVLTRDLFRGDRGLIMDVGMSETGVKNMVFACRIINPGGSGFSMATSGVLFADRSILEKILTEIPKRFGETGGEIAVMSLEKRTEFSASILRIFLEGNSSSGIAYINPAMKEIVKTKPQVGRNEPCPCGSGKKHKKCCGK